MDKKKIFRYIEISLIALFILSIIGYFIFEASFEASCQRDNNEIYCLLSVIIVQSLSVILILLVVVFVIDQILDGMEKSREEMKKMVKEN